MFAFLATPTTPEISRANSEETSLSDTTSCMFLTTQSLMLVFASATPAIPLTAYAFSSALFTRIVVVAPITSLSVEI